LSDIIKSGFISFSEQKKTIENIDKESVHIIGAKETKANNTELEERKERKKKEFVSKEEAEAIRNSAKEEGYQEGLSQGKEAGYQAGYAEGIQKANEELTHRMEERQKEAEAELSQLKEELQKEFTEYKTGLEPKILDIIEELVKKLIGSQQYSRGTIMHLIKSGLDELEIRGDFVIRVSSFDFDYVEEHIQLITDTFSGKISVEILKDQTLSQNECVIETEMGTIDCGLGTQMKGLLDELSLLRESMSE